MNKKTIFLMSFIIGINSLLFSKGSLNELTQNCPQESKISFYKSLFLLMVNFHL